MNKSQTRHVKRNRTRQVFVAVVETVHGVYH